MGCTAVDLIKFSDLAFVLSVYVPERDSLIGTHAVVFSVYKLDIQAGRILRKSPLPGLFAGARSDWSASRSSLPLSCTIYTYNNILAIYIYIYIYICFI